MRITALDALNYNSNNLSLMNPYKIEGLYPSLPTTLDLLPFQLPNPLLLDNLSYLFNKVSVWRNQTLYRQIIDSSSSWHTLVDNCTVSELILPVSTAKSIRLEGPISIKTIILDNPLSFNSSIYTVYITKYVGSAIQRIAHEFNSTFFSRLYKGITNPVINTYMAVVKDILNAQPDNEIEIKGYSIKYVSDVLYINNQAYENIDLPIVAWLMYTLFN